MIGAGTGSEGRAVKVSMGALLEGKGTGARGVSCPVGGCLSGLVNRGSSAKRVRACSGVPGLGDPIPVSD